MSRDENENFHSSQPIDSKQVGAHTDFTDYTDGKSLTPLLAFGVSANGQEPTANGQQFIAQGSSLTNTTH